VSEPLTFIIGELKVHADIPQSWSYSGLRDFEDCPMRWALSRTRIACFGGAIPQKPTKSNVEGILLHKLLELYDRHLREKHDEPFRPRGTLLKLLEEWEQENENNPRIRAKVLASQIGIEDLSVAFGKAARYIRGQEPKPAAEHPAHKKDKARSSSNYAEVVLKDPESKLMGRADHIESGKILDFKSGNPAADHTEQILFYAALYLAKVGEIPKSLQLIYPISDAIVNVTPPGTTALREVLEQMRQRAAAADKRILGGDILAKPEPDKCAICGVRGLCDKYWEITDPSRLQVSDRPGVVDYSPSAHSSLDLVANGGYIRDIFGDRPCYLCIPANVLVNTGKDFRRIRVLALRPHNENERVRLAFTQSSEVYLFESA
jgi:hypothetical protein